MHRLSSILTLVVLAIAFPGAGGAAAQTQGGVSADSAKRTAIRRILALQHVDSLMLAGVEKGFAEQTNAAAAGVPPGFWDALHARVRRDIGQFVERLVPVYDSLYTAEEIDGLLAFYQTPLGRRILENEPRIGDAMMREGQSWAMEEAGQVMVDLSRRATTNPPN